MPNSRRQVRYRPRPWAPRSEWFDASQQQYDDAEAEQSEHGDQACAEACKPYAAPVDEKCNTPKSEESNHG